MKPLSEKYHKAPQYQKYPFIVVQSIKLCPTLCSLMNCSIPGSSVLHCLPEFAQIHVQLVGDMT